MTAVAHSRGGAAATMPPNKLVGDSCIYIHNLALQANWEGGTDRGTEIINYRDRLHTAQSLN